MSADEHFEVHVLRRSGWTLNSISPDMRSAVETASTLLESEGISNVKVIHARFNPTRGVFEETDVPVPGARGGKGAGTGSQRGAAAPPATAADDGGGPDVWITGARARAVGSGSGGTCRDPDDLYTRTARRLIARHVSSHLDTHTLTPSELLHSSAHFHRLQNSGTTLQAAVQQAAIAHGKRLKTGAPALVKAIWQAIEEAAARIKMDETAAESVLGAVEGDLRAIDAALRAAHVNGAAKGDDPDPVAAWTRRRRLLIAVTRLLDGAEGWQDKLTRLALLVPDEPVADELAPLDMLLAEISVSAGGLSVLLGAGHGALAAATTGGGRRPQKAVIADLFNLLDGTAPPAADDPEVAAALGRLFALLRNGMLPETAVEILDRIAQEVESGRRMVPGGDSDRLIEEGEAIAEVLARSRRLQKILIETETVEGPSPLAARIEAIDEAVSRILVALETRSEILLRPERLGAKLSDFDAVTDMVTYMLELGRHLVGEINQHRLGRLLLTRLEGEAPQIRLVEVNGSQALTNLKCFGAWQKEIEDGRLPASLRIRLTTALDDMCQRLLDRMRLFSNIARQKPDPVDQALAYVDLVNSRLITNGGAFDVTRKRVVACVQAAGGPEAFVRALKARDVRSKHLVAIQRFLSNGT